MEKKYLIINTGSNSHKYALYEGDKEICFVHIESEGEGYVSHFKFEGKSTKKNIQKEDFENSIFFLSNELESKKISITDVSAVGIRIVAPGVFFQSHRLINGEYIEKIKEVESITPNHISRILPIIAYLKDKVPHTPLFGISDTAFHVNMRDVAKIYGIDKRDASDFGIYRYGFHGLSVSSVLAQIEKKQRIQPPKIIICHLGGGASITAVENGKSVDTSMGFSPLEGLPMSSRVGDIDVSAALYLLNKRQINTSQAEKYFSSECGLSGISGKSSDMREILELAHNGDKDAKLAVDYFVYKIQKQIGAYIAALNGLSLLVFCGTIGERSFIIRSKVCQNLQNLGIEINESKNIEINGVGKIEGNINVDNAIPTVVLHTDEMSQILQETKYLSE